MCLPGVWQPTPTLCDGGRILSWRGGSTFFCGSDPSPKANRVIWALGHGHWLLGQTSRSRGGGRERIGRQCVRCDMGPSEPPSLMMKEVTSYPMPARCGGSRACPSLQPRKLPHRGWSAVFTSAKQSTQRLNAILPPHGCCAGLSEILGRRRWELLLAVRRQVVDARAKRHGYGSQSGLSSRSGPRCDLLVVAPERGKCQECQEFPLPSRQSRPVAVSSRSLDAVFGALCKSKCSSFCRRSQCYLPVSALMTHPQREAGMLSAKLPIILARNFPRQPREGAADCYSAASSRDCQI